MYTTGRPSSQNLNGYYLYTTVQITAIKPESIVSADTDIEEIISLACDTKCL